MGTLRAILSGRTKFSFARSTILLLAALSLTTLAASPLHALNLKHECQLKCAVGNIMCQGNFPPNVNSCLTDCSVSGNTTGMDELRACIASCSSAGCVQQCNSAHQASFATCSQGCMSNDQCTGRYFDCLRTCNSKPECTQNFDCAKNICNKGVCVLACKTNQECKGRLHSDDAVCLTVGQSKGTCALR
jgi:hypothetical protein